MKKLIFTKNSPSKSLKHVGPVVERPDLEVEHAHVGRDDVVEWHEERVLESVRAREHFGPQRHRLRLHFVLLARVLVVEQERPFVGSENYNLSEKLNLDQNI